MTRFGTFVTSTVVAALMSVVPDASGQSRGVPARGDEALRPIAAAMQGSVDGVVLDDAGVPVVGATVSALGATSALAITDRGGRFALGNLSPGPYLLRAHINGYIPSKRQFVEVRAAATTMVAVSIRRTARVMAAGVGAADAGDDNQPIDDHSEVAWRLRHVPRSALKDVSTSDGFVGGTDSSRDKQNGLARAVGSSAHFASALFDDLPFTGQVNLLTTGSFDSVQGLFSSDVMSRQLAALSLRGAAGGWGDWSIQGITSQGDLGSWFVSGTLKSHVPASHVYDVNVAYSAKRSSTSSLLPLATTPEDNRAVGTLYAVDRWRIDPQVTLTYAARYSHYDYLGGAGFISPSAELALRPTKTFQVRTSVSRHVLVPGAEEFLPPLAAGLWVPTERTFNWLSPTSLSAERTNSYAVAIDHDLGRGYTVTARAFYQEVHNQLFAIFGLDRDATSTTSSPYHAGTIGDMDARGWSVGLSNLGGKHVRGSVAYEMTTAQWRDVAEGGILTIVAPSLIRTSEQLHDVVATVDTQMPVTATHLFVLYRIDTAFARRATPDSVPGLDARFDVQITQPLPMLDFTSAQWQVVFAVRNLFREPSPDGSVYDELLVVRPPKRLVGGLVVRF